MELDIDLVVINGMNGLRKRLVLSYMMVTMICVFLMSVLSNLFLERQFKKYVIEGHRKKNEDIIRTLTSEYENGKWNETVLERIGVDGLENGLIISIRDGKGRILWDANAHNNGRCEALISHMASNMMSRYPNWKGGYVRDEYPILYDHTQVGSVIIGYYGPFYYSDHDILFLNTLNKVFIIVGLVSLLIAFILGLLMAERLARPISKVINAAELISRGRYKSRINEKSKVMEINKLVTTVNNLAQALEDQENLRKRLTGDVAHELRTPLTTLQSHMEAILDGVWEPTMDRIKSFHEETLRINRLVGDLEKLANYESDNLVLNKTEFNLTSIARSILLNFEKEYMDKNITVHLDESSEVIVADKDKISQVIINLLSNALKYTPVGGKVDIGIRRTKGEVVFYIKDNGPGILKEDLPFIFERFYRADKSRNRITGGAGIGLTITKSIVEAHGGRIIVESEPEEGTEFKVWLPIVDKIRY
jgi:two-component system, OmpR family, sensor histidine kinase BaeS